MVDKTWDERWPSYRQSTTVKQGGGFFLFEICCFCSSSKLRHWLCWLDCPSVFTSKCQHIVWLLNNTYILIWNWRFITYDDKNTCLLFTPYLRLIEIKDTTDTTRLSASYLDLQLEIDNEGRLRTKLYDKRDDFNFPIVNFPVICSNIPVAPSYGVDISQLIRYSSLVHFFRWYELALKGSNDPLIKMLVNNIIISVCVVYLSFHRHNPQRLLSNP